MLVNHTKKFIFLKTVKTAETSVEGLLERFCLPPGVESAGLNSENPVCQFEGNRVFHNASSESEENFNRGGWSWFLPSPSCLERWMIEAGFENVDFFYSSVINRVFGYGRRARFVPITKAGFSRPDID